jgi:pyruvate formate lyase activating enzyme
MISTLYTVPGCVRCRVARSFLEQQATPYEELDIQGEGKTAFQQLYRLHRAEIHRGPEGIEFPILSAGDAVIQGVGPICAWLQAGDLLQDAVERSELSHGWVDGLHLSKVDPEQEETFLAVLTHLKEQGLFLQPDTDGRNPHLLSAVIENRLADRLVFHLLGPTALYPALTGRRLDDEALSQSLQLAVQAPAYEFVLRLLPFKGEDGGLGYLPPEAAAQTAALVELATGSKKQPFVIEAVAPGQEQDLAPLDQPALFKYRRACRRYQVLADIRK